MSKAFYSLTFVISSLLAIIFVVFSNFIVDPFTYYHRPWIPINISSNHRYSNPGLAKHLEYNLALIGTSHVVEIESSKLSDVFGEPAVNLATTGSLIKGQSQLAEFVLQQGKAHTLLWEMNYPSFEFGEIYSQSGEEFPLYFYKPSIETHFRYLMSMDTLMHSLRAMRNPGRVTLDNRNRPPAHQFSEARVMANWDFQLQRWDSNTRRLWSMHMSSVESPETLIERHVIPLLEQNPEVNFGLFFPPVSVMMFLQFASRGDNDFLVWLRFRDALADLTQGFPNVRLYDFQSDWNLVSDLDLYRDIEHYNGAVLENMFVQMKLNGDGHSRSEILVGTRRLREQVTDFGYFFCTTQPIRCPEQLKSRVGLSEANN